PLVRTTVTRAAAARVTGPAPRASPAPLFTVTPTTELYTLSLHDALPISPCSSRARRSASRARTPAAAPSCSATRCCTTARPAQRDRKSTRLNSSHVSISYAVFCLKKKTRERNRIHTAPRTPQHAPPQHRH